MTTDLITLGVQIQNARNAKDLTVHQLAEMMGVSVTGMKNWESDKSVPRVENLRQLEALLNAHFVVTGIKRGDEQASSSQLRPGVTDEIMDLAVEIASLPEEKRMALKMLVGLGAKEAEGERRKKPAPSTSAKEGSREASRKVTVRKPAARKR